MCGIAGWFCYGDARVPKNSIVNLFKELKWRGRDAAGIAYSDINEQGAPITMVIKAGCCADDFIGMPSFTKSLDAIALSRWGLMHTRQATHGTAANNSNNHPIYNKQGLIIHNGIISVGEKLKADGQTDTEQIMLNIQKYGWDGIDKISGSLAIAYKDYVKEGFYLYAHTSPLVWGWHSALKTLFFCSQPDLLVDAIGPKKIFGVISNLPMNHVPADTVYYVGPSGVKLIQKSTPKAYVTTYELYKDYNKWPNTTQQKVDTSKNKDKTAEEITAELNKLGQTLDQVEAKQMGLDELDSSEVSGNLLNTKEDQELLAVLADGDPYLPIRYRITDKGCNDG